MTKTKRVTIQTAIAIIVAIFTIYTIIFSIINNDYWDQSFYLFDDLTLLNILFGSFIIWLVIPVLCVLALFRRHKKTPILDKGIRIFLYVNAVNLLVNLLYHFEYIFIHTEEYGFSYLTFYYETDEFFWLKIIFSIAFYVIPAVLFFIAARLGLDKIKKTAEIKQ